MNLAYSTNSSCYKIENTCIVMVKGERSMDQIKTGKFIARCRKEKKLTQAQLAERLSITDRAVSKWETGVSQTKGY